jgi:hypothetical protein
MLLSARFFGANSFHQRDISSTITKLFYIRFKEVGILEDGSQTSWVNGSFALAEFVSTKWGARKLTGENLKLVWAEFSTIS